MFAQGRPRGLIRLKLPPLLDFPQAPTVIKTTSLVMALSYTSPGTTRLPVLIDEVLQLQVLLPIVVAQDGLRRDM